MAATDVPAGADLDLSAGVFTPDDDGPGAGGADRHLNPVPPAADDGPPVCRHCSGPIEWSGRGRRPGYCSDRCRKDAKKPPAAATAAPARKPAKPGAKKPAGALYGAAYGAAGYGIQLRGPEPWAIPVGRIMQFQAADAGPRIERQLAKVLDKLPFKLNLGANAELGRDLAALLGPPIVTMMIATGSIPQFIAEPMFISVISPIMEHALAQAGEQAEQVTQMTEAQAAAIDATRHFMEAIFGAAEPEQQEQP